ncbi:hypothetical protein MBEHAL_1689 [Halarchaeum acidiphilum MH1-52-1]|uniref:Uncharacterized protein n=1 Tax=Halarchaeum acidiphilum MH1-52-1 TaxID=1261545 RepID=U3A5K9_9EURY|nr:hypothetical protein [Halarchaeum acidiphilum]GAD52929.1 hypothetical protein MBEHAL_1689 [Halarchaeum acidiphilum MH1-52-1]
MPTTRADALGTVAGYAEAARHTHEGTLESFTDRHGASCRGYRFTTASDEPFLVYGPASADYLYVTSHHSPVQALAFELGEPDVEEYASRDVAYEDGDEPERRVAARAVIDEADGMSEVVDEIESDCDTADVSYEPHYTRNGALADFYFHRRLYPGGRFAAEDFDAAVRAVTTTVTRAYRAYYRLLDLPVLEGDGEEEPPSRTDYVSGGRGFQ